MLLLAGEASGDQYGGALAQALRARIPDVELVGMGGPRMRDAGVALRAELDRLSVMGFAEVLPRLPYFLGLERRMVRELEDGAVRLVIPIDFPGFNLRIARAARGAGVPVLYYVAPQVWAWREGRARVLAEVADRVAVILPFEVDFLTRRGVRATFVGHPLLDPAGHSGSTRDAFCRRWGLEPGRTFLALLPGSRPQEVTRHLGVFAEAARRVQRSRPEVLPVIARAAGQPAAVYERAGLPVVDGARDLLQHARAALAKSGTGTLEAALAGTPLVVAYRTSRMTWALAARLVRVPHIALPNLIAQERVVPEHVQGAVTAARLAEDLLPLLADGEERDGQLEAFSRIRQALGGPGVAERVADIAVELLKARL